MPGGFKLFCIRIFCHGISLAKIISLRLAPPMPMHSTSIMNGTVYSGPLQSDADILNQLSSHTVHVLNCASSVMNLIAEIGESLEYACMQQGP